MTKLPHLLLGALAITFAASAVPQARADNFPDRPIRLVVPFGVGGTSDIYARVISRIIEEKKILPQPVVVLNVPGAGSAVGTRQVKDAAADGYTLLFSHQAVITAGVMGLADFGPEELEPIAEFGRFCSVYAVAEASPYKTFGDLLAAGKKNPGSIRESTNIGSVIHFASLMLSDKTGLNPRYVRASATPERITHLLGGHAEVAVFSIAELGAVKDNGVRVILTMSPEPDRFAPNIPTARSLGYDTVFCVRNWIFAPKGTPAERVSAITGALRKVFDTPEMKQEFEKFSSEATLVVGTEFADLVASEAKSLRAMSNLVPK